MDRVGIAGNAAKQHNIAFGDGPAVDRGHADREILEIMPVEFAIERFGEVGIGGYVARHEAGLRVCCGAESMLQRNILFGDRVGKPAPNGAP